MPESVPSPSQVQATFCATLVDEWLREGLREAVICPGSRSTPLAVALAAREEVDLHVRIDERSAAFFALGRSLATDAPVLLLVTSGTAAAELHAAVAEADRAGVALLVVTADRPPELHDVGAPQTINQNLLYGAMVRHYAEPGVARLDAAASWRPLAGRLWRACVGADGRRGPVHLNAAFIEPLLGDALPLPAGRDDSQPWMFAPIAPAVRSAIDVAGSRVLCIVGAGASTRLIDEAKSLDWTVIGDATARGCVSYADPLLRSDATAAALRPDVVIRCGGLPASKWLAQRLREWAVPVYAYEGAGALSDPDGLISQRLPGLPNLSSPQLRGDRSYVERWNEASNRVDRAIDEFLGDALCEPAVARDVVTLSAELSAALVVGSSMPVRDVEWWSPPRTTATYANRGANGIDGVVSTFLGVATNARAIGLVGDVTFLHDVSALVDGTTASTHAVLVVVDNAGGGIFSFLPQAEALAQGDFELLYATPRSHDLVAVAQAFGHDAVRVTNRSALRDAVRDGVATPGLSVVVAQVPDRDRNVALHELLNAEVALWTA